MNLVFKPLLGAAGDEGLEFIFYRENAFPFRQIDVAAVLAAAVLAKGALQTIAEIAQFENVGVDLLKTGNGRNWNQHVG